MKKVQTSLVLLALVGTLNAKQGGFGRWLQAEEQNAELVAAGEEAFNNNTQAAAAELE